MTDQTEATTPAPADLRQWIAEALWRAAERDIIAEWICCEPVDPAHDLCSQGAAAMRMVKSLIFDGDRTLADAVLAVVQPELDRHAALKRAHVALAEQAGRDQAAIERVRRLARYTRDQTETRGADWAIGQHELAVAVLDALDEPPAAVCKCPPELCRCNHQAAHDVGPTVAEATANDRNWDVERAGE